MPNLLVQPAERVRLDRAQLVLVDREDLQRVQPLEGPVVDDGDAVVVQVQDQQVVQVLERTRRHRHQLVLGHVQLGQATTWSLRGRRKKISSLR